MSKKGKNIAHLAEKVTAGNRGALSQAITLIESQLREHRKEAYDLMNKIYPSTGESIRVGISGIPGAGKSTFIEALGNYLIEHCGKRVAVLAIDPSSTRTAGSILGDKTRMEHLSRKQEAFIRPSPTNTTLGGVGQHTQEAILLCEAAGYDIILLETVGIGQSEQAVNDMVDVFILLQIVGAGDHIQAIKRGVLECVDIVVINKADGDRKKQAISEAKNLKKGLSFFTQKHPHWDTPVLSCSALEKKGIDIIWTSVEHLCKLLKSTNAFKAQRERQLKTWLETLKKQSLQNYIEAHPIIKAWVKKNHTEYALNSSSPFEKIQALDLALTTLFDNKFGQ